MRNTVYPFIALLLLSWFLEFGLGIMVLHWFWGTAWYHGDESTSATIARLANDAYALGTGGNLEHVSQRWTPEGVLTFLIWLFVGGHVVYALWFGLFAPKLQRWRLGARKPSQREREVFDKAYAQLDGPLMSRPRVWKVADGVGLQSRWIGYVLVVDRELIHHRYFPAVLAHELGHVNAEDRLAHRLSAMLPQPRAIVCLIGGFAFGIGHILLFPLWVWYWRSRIYAADAYAVRCGQGHALVKALHELYLKLDTTTRYGRIFKPVPYIEQRINRLQPLLEA